MEATATTASMAAVKLQLLHRLPALLLQRVVSIVLMHSLASSAGLLALVVLCRVVFLLLRCVMLCFCSVAFSVVFLLLCFCCRDVLCCVSVVFSVVVLRLCCCDVLCCVSVVLFQSVTVLCCDVYLVLRCVVFLLRCFVFLPF